MCLTIPKQVTLVKDGYALLKFGSKQQKAGCLVKVKKGDWVLTQNSVIIRKISKKNASEINKLLSKNI